MADTKEEATGRGAVLVDRGPHRGQRAGVTALDSKPPEQPHSRDQMTQQPTKEQRRTRQRAAIDEVLDETDDFTSAQQLHSMLRDRGSRIGLATVYRTLQTLAEDGRVDVLRTDSGVAVYRRCRVDDHHHHLVCRSCGAAVEIARPAVESWTSQVAREHGYIDVTHTVEIFGLCPRCAAATERSTTSERSTH